MLKSGRSRQTWRYQAKIKATRLVEKPYRPSSRAGNRPMPVQVVRTPDIPYPYTGDLCEPALEADYPKH